VTTCLASCLDICYSLTFQLTGRRSKLRIFTSLHVSRVITWVVLFASLCTAMAPLAGAAAKSRRCVKTVCCCVRQGAETKATPSATREHHSLMRNTQDCPYAQACSVRACVPEAVASSVTEPPQMQPRGLDQTAAPTGISFDLITPPNSRV
jgi:hypothetical protein